MAGRGRRISLYTLDISLGSYLLPSHLINIVLEDLESMSKEKTEKASVSFTVNAKVRWSKTCRSIRSCYTRAGQVLHVANLVPFDQLLNVSTALSRKV